MTSVCSSSNYQFCLTEDALFIQALPLVSTFWGVVLFGEYRKSSRRTYILLGSMLFMFIVAVAVLMASSGHRKWSFNLREIIKVFLVLNIESEKCWNDWSSVQRINAYVWHQGFGCKMCTYIIIFNFQLQEIVAKV